MSRLFSGSALGAACSALMTLFLVRSSDVARSRRVCVDLDPTQPSATRPRDLTRTELAPSRAPMVARASRVEPSRDAKIGHDVQVLLERVAPDATVAVLIEATARARAAELAALYQRRGLVARALERAGLVAVQVAAAEVASLARDALVSRICRDAPVRGTLDLACAAIGADQAAAVGAGLDGEGMVVAVIDSGIAPHADLDDRLLMQLDLRAGVTPDPADGAGHGTHVASIIAGSGRGTQGGSRTLRGVAPRARLISLRVLDQNGVGRTSDLIAAIDWVAEHARDASGVQQIHVLNLSVGHPPLESFTTDPLVRACARAVDMGVVVVAAAGNDGCHGDLSLHGGILSPANAPFVIAVGAADGHGTVSRADDDVAAFSSKGPTVIDGLLKPDLVAPGVAMLAAIPAASTLAQQHTAAVVDSASLGAQPGSTYLALSGTSAAAPLVTGTVALMRQANPSLTPGAIKLILGYTAEKLLHPGVLAQGAGLLNAEGAVRVAHAIAPNADAIAVGEPWLRDDAALVPFSSIDDRPVAFGCSLVASGSIVWGENVLGVDAQALQPMWGSSLPFEDSLAQRHGGEWRDALLRLKPSGALPGCDHWSELASSGLQAKNAIWSPAMCTEWQGTLIDPSSITIDYDSVTGQSDSGMTISLTSPADWYYPKQP